MAENNHIVSFDDEMLILVNDRDEVTGYADKLACHRDEGILHRAFSIFIFNDKKELLLQQRSEQKHLWPLIWSNSCCSHPRKGEELENATQRRMAEELGITTPLQHLFTFQYHARYKSIGSEREMCAVYIGHSNDLVQVNPNEIAEIRWIGLNELTRELALHADNYSPWIKMEWERLMLAHHRTIQQLF